MQLVLQLFSEGIYYNILSSEVFVHFEKQNNPRFCFMSSGLINQEALREHYPSLSIGCFIKKPTTMEKLIKRVKSELE